jgi:hypothetical protein
VRTREVPVLQARCPSRRRLLKVYTIHGFCKGQKTAVTVSISGCAAAGGGSGSCSRGLSSYKFFVVVLDFSSSVMSTMLNIFHTVTVGLH